jgi:spermidine/putrescine transport system permease protein
VKSAQPNRQVIAPPLAVGSPWWLWIHSGITYIFLYLPIAILVFYSFSRSEFNTIWGGFTTDWYRGLAENEEKLSALRNSLVLGLSATAIGGVLGTAAALGHARIFSSSGKWIEVLFILPIMIPDIVLALALKLHLEKILGLTADFGMVKLLAGHGLLAMCYVFMVVSTRLRGFDWRLMEAAHDLGAGGWKAFRHVQLPLLWPGVIGGMLLAFAISLDEYVITSFLKGPGQNTLPIAIAADIKRTPKPEINALATLMLLSSVILAILSALVQRRGAK